MRPSAPPPSAVAEREPCERKRLFTLRRAALLDTPLLDRRTATAAIASLWLDGSFKAAQVKEERASLASWHAKRRAFRRAGGLRRQIVGAMAERIERDEGRRAASVREQAHRMRVWQLEDSAAVAIQQRWRERSYERAQQSAYDTSLQFRRTLLERERRSDADERARLVAHARLRTRQRSTRRMLSSTGTSSEGGGGGAATATSPHAPSDEAAHHDEALAERLAWTATLDVKQVSERVEADLEPLLQQLQAWGLAAEARAMEVDAADDDDERLVEAVFDQA